MKRKNNYQPILLIAFAFTIGLFLGFMFHVPYFSIKGEVDLSALVSIIALFAATLIVPLVINKHLTDSKTCNSMLVNDIDEVIALLNTMKDYYAKISFEKQKIKNKDRGYILQTCTTIQNSLDNLDPNFKKSSSVLDFSSTVMIFTKEVRPAYTDFLVEGKKINSTSAMNALNAMGKLVAALKATRYKLYTY